MTEEPTKFEINQAVMADLAAKHMAATWHADDKARQQAYVDGWHAALLWAIQQNWTPPQPKELPEP